MTHRTRQLRSPRRAGFERGFTLIEVVLASILGLIVASACLGVFAAMNRTDRSLERRFKEIGQLERIHTVMQRAFMSLVVSEQLTPQRPSVRPGESPPPGTPAGARADAGASPRGSRDPGRGGGSHTVRRLGPDGKPLDTPAQDDNESPAAGAAPGSSDLPPPPKRIDLNVDAAVGQWPMGHPLARMQVGSPVQSLELVLSNFPLSAQAARRPTVKSSNDGRADRESDQTPPDVSAIPALRGVFLLRPSVADADSIRSSALASTSDGRQSEARQSWDLFWQPLHAGDIAGQPAEASGEPVEVASGLAYCRWQVFHDRLKKTVFSATQLNEIPAYVEMEVVTVGGLWASWVFEVAWSTGQENAVTEGSKSSKGDSAAGASADSKNAAAQGTAVSVPGGRKVALPAAVKPSARRPHQ